MRVCTPSPMPTLAQPPVAAAYVNYFGRLTMVCGSIVVSISACHAEDPGSIPGRGGALLATEAGTGRALRRASVARVTARTVTCLADSALRAKSRCNMPAGTPARHAKIPGSIPGRGAQHAHAARRAGHGPRAVAHMGRPRHCCTPGTSALRPLLRAPRAGLLLQHVDPLVLCQRPARATSPCGCAPPRSHPRHPPLLSPMQVLAEGAPRSAVV